MRTAEDIAQILGKIAPVDPFNSGLTEIYPRREMEPPLSAMFVREAAARIVTRRMAYSLQDLYSLLKYTTDLDQTLARAGMQKFSWRPGSDVIGCGEAFAALWRGRYVRKFCRGFMNESAGGRPVGVKWLIKW